MKCDISGSGDIHLTFRPICLGQTNWRLVSKVELYRNVKSFIHSPVTTQEAGIGFNPKRRDSFAREFLNKTRDRQYIKLTLTLGQSLLSFIGCVWFSQKLGRRVQNPASKTSVRRNRDLGRDSLKMRGKWEVYLIDVKTLAGPNGTNS